MSKISSEFLTENIYKIYVLHYDTQAGPPLWDPVDSEPILPDNNFSQQLDGWMHPGCHRNYAGASSASTCGKPDEVFELADPADRGLMTKNTSQIW